MLIPTKPINGLIAVIASIAITAGCDPVRQKDPVFSDHPQSGTTMNGSKPVTKRIKALASTSPMTSEAAKELFLYAGGKDAASTAAKSAIDRRVDELREFAEQWKDWEPPEGMKDLEKMGAMIAIREGAKYCLSKSEQKAPTPE